MIAATYVVLGMKCINSNYVSSKPYRDDKTVRYQFRIGNSKKLVNSTDFLFTLGFINQICVFLVTILTVKVLTNDKHLYKLQ